MILRELRVQDAAPMLEWMHDANVVSDLKGNFLEKTLSDCTTFIENSRRDSGNIHLAIADDQDHYMGTVSLKHIHSEWAEFAIVICRAAMGTGISSEAMESMLQYGSRELGLSRIYWCVDKKNTRAVHFYNKHRYMLTKNIPPQLKAFYQQEGDSLLWYHYGA